MWARVESNTIVEILTRPKALTIGDTNYPSNIFELWDTGALRALGIFPVVQDNTNFKDKEYYINTNQTFTFADNKVTASYGTATAKSLDDSGSGENLVKGLKTLKKEVINNQAGGILAPTDWMVIRAAEGGTSVPSSITTKRAAVRTKANSMCAQIDGAANVDALAALYVYTNTGTEENPVFTRPLGELPTV
tara:strand:+ start:503 stop:1078 length:576 start_codon:yes stop_codon:yes gene_type:complete